MAFSIDALKLDRRICSASDCNLVSPAVSRIILILQSSARIVGAPQYFSKLDFMAANSRRLRMYAVTIMHSVYTLSTSEAARPMRILVDDA